MTSKGRTGPLVSLGASVLVVVGSVLPWATATHIFGTASIAGTDGDGKITLAIGIALGLLALLELSGRVLPDAIAFFGSNRFVLIGSAAVLAVAVYDYVTVSDRIAGVSSEYVHASVGSGLYLVVAGGLLGFVGSLMSRES